MHDQKKKPGKGCPASLNTALQKSNAALSTAAKKGDSTMINPAIINAFADGCTPRVLVVTDMSFQKGVGFSLSQFVDTLLAAGMEVTRANLEPRPGEPQGTLLNFQFDNPENGLSRDRYDVCFIFAFRSDGSWLNFAQSSLPPNELDAIEEFMQAGGGVFATGDHEDLGAGICRDIIRVRNMRKWTAGQGVPSFSGEDRLSTILSGDDELYEFDDQSDRHPQRLYLNRRTEAGGVDMPHPLMQVKTSDGKNAAIVHIPDHPHEGECIIPDNLEREFVNGEPDNLRLTDEWPVEIGGDKRISPEIVAKSMSHGGDLIDSAKAPLVPREFIAIAAYDGHRAGVGRVVTDATWHHFIDINIDGTGSDPDDPRIIRLYGLMLPPSDGSSDPVDDSQALIRLRQHWRNLAEWLMPLEGRLGCMAIIRIFDAVSSILMDELNIPAPDQRNAETDERLGRQIKMKLDEQLLPYQVNDLVETVLTMGISDGAERRAADERLKMIALGALTAALHDQELSSVEEMLAKLTEAVAASVARV